MKLGIISDTHGDTVGTQRAMDIFRLEGVQEIIHCGDVGSAEVVNLLAELPCHYVLGNTDPPSTIRNAILKANQTCYDYLGMIVREGIRIAFLHGHDWRTLEEIITSGKHDVVCTGHTHEFAWQILNETRILNPGAIHRTSAPSVAILHLPQMQVQLERI